MKGEPAAGIPFRGDLVSPGGPTLGELRAERADDLGELDKVIL